MEDKEKKSIQNILWNNIVYIVILIVFFCIIPLYKCSEIPLYNGSNDYIDMSSIYKEHNNKSTTYSFWAKHKYEDSFDQTEINVSCSNRSIATKTWLKSKDGKIIQTWKNDSYRYKRDSIIPKTISEKYYKIICQPHTRYIYKFESAYPQFRWKFSIIED